MTISHSQFLMMQARCEPSRPRIRCSDEVEREADLHAAIMAECANHGWLFFHTAMHKKSTATRGMPDFLVYCDGGRHFMIEAKDRDGKLSIDQTQVHAHARKLDHTVHVIRNIEAFRELTGIQKTFADYPGHD